MSTRRKLNLCACGKSKEAVASTCRACYLSSARRVRQPIRTRKQAAAALEAYWPIWEHYRGRAAA